MTVEEKEQLFIESLKIDANHESSVLKHETIIVTKASLDDTVISQINSLATHSSFDGWLFSIKFHYKKNNFLFQDLYLFTGSSKQISGGTHIFTQPDTNYFIFNSVLKMICNQILKTVNKPHYPRYENHTVLINYLEKFINSQFSKETKVSFNFENNDKSVLYCLDNHINNYLKSQKILEKL